MFINTFNMKIILFLMLSFLLVSLILFLSYRISGFLLFRSFKDGFKLDQLNPYECGFESYGDARFKFKVHYYLIAISFIIFDLEVLLLFPWVYSFTHLNSEGIFAGFTLIFLLSLGLLYEWYKGILDWNIFSKK